MAGTAVPSEEDVQALVDQCEHEVECFVMFSHLFWGLWSLLQVRHMRLCDCEVACL